jgi:hypothetical protein
LTTEIFPAKWPAMKHADQLLLLANAYCEATGVTISGLGEVAVRHHKFFKRIAAGQAYLSSKGDEALAWFAANWPADAPWPDGIDRPAAIDADAAQ